MLHMLQEIPLCSQAFSSSDSGSVQHACDMKRIIFRLRKSKPAAPCEATGFHQHTRTPPSTTCAAVRRAAVAASWGVDADQCGQVDFVNYLIS
jgi:hypothetical protein